MTYLSNLSFFKYAFYVLLLFSLSGCATVPITNRSQIQLISQSQLVDMSNQSYAKLISESKLSSDIEKINTVKTIGQKISKTAEIFLKENNMESSLKYYDWQFNLIENDKTINAFCMPGGKIAVYTGILKLTEDENGLAVVIGHEIAHAIANHSNERLSQTLIQQLGASALASLLNKESKELQNIILAAYGIGSTIGALLPYSRDQEKEADKIGLILMAKSGYNPESAVGFWERMNKLGGSTPEFLSTHPAPETRINEIRNYIPEAMKYYIK